MPDPDDLERLRNADPVAPGSLPSAHDRRARALFEEITMSDTTTTTDPEVGPDPSSPSPRRPVPAWLAAAAALVAVVAAAAALSVFGGDGGDDRPTPDDGATATGPITPGGTASCVELYDTTTLAKREVAFDGTVTAVNGDSITFTVNRVFRGVEGSTVTLQGATGLSGLTSAGDGMSVEPGSRLLVAGDGGFAWSCGFTQPYDDAVAAQWAATFGK